MVQKITIVTVVYNAEDIIEETILSVVNQTYPNMEYIIVDGASSDNTVEIIKRYGQHISLWISEPDKGIYDAMNKGIRLATGDWINFLNAGDRFYSHDVIKKVFSRNNINNADLIYGDYIWQGQDKEILVPARPLDQMWKRISFSHQSLFCRTSIMKKEKFDTRYKIVSDYAFYFKAYAQGMRFQYVGIPIAIFLPGGLSDINFLCRTFERWSVVKKYKKGVSWNIYYIKLLLSHYWGIITAGVKNILR